MTLIFFKYLLPILLGYTIFVGIAGQYMPFYRPKIAKKRPLWFLGLWAGTALALVIMVGQHLAYQMKLSELSTLVTPGVVILSAALLPGMIIFYWYRWHVKRQTPHSSNSESLNNTEIDDANRLDNTLASNAQLSHEQKNDELDATIPLDRTDRVSVDDPKINSTDKTDHPGQSDTTLDEKLLFAVEQSECNEPLLVNVETQTESETLAESDDEKVAEMATEVDSETKTTISAETTRPELADSKVFALKTAELTACKQEIIRLRDELEAETLTRKELETHLRITRKGLGVLESESREFESHKATALIKIERELEEKIKRTAAAEARADREMSKRADLENEMLLLREDALKATTDCRISTEARASAINTANRATIFARQAMQIRAELESKLSDLKVDLDNKQATISSLIKALEKEKSRTQEDVSRMAKQLRLHEKQLQARRTLEEVSRTVDNKLSTRLVKKVAKSRN